MLCHFAVNPLICGCDIKWLVLDPVLMDRLADETTCSDGVKRVKDLPAEAFEDCPAAMNYNFNVI